MKSSIYNNCYFQMGGNDVIMKLAEIGSFSSKIAILRKLTAQIWLYFHRQIYLLLLKAPIFEFEEAQNSFCTLQVLPPSLLKI